MKHIVPDARWDESRQYWRVNVQQNGNRKTFYDSTPGRKGKKLCEAKAQDWLDSNAPGDIRFDAAVERYMEFKKRRVKPQTLDGYERNFRLHILPKLGKKKLSALTQMNYQAVMDDLADKGYSQGLIRAVWGQLSDLTKFCRKSGWQAAVLECLDLPNEAKAPKPRKALQPEHLAILFSDDPSARNDRFYHLNAFRLAAIIGLRRGELVGLRWDDIKDGTLTVQRSVDPHGNISTPKTENGYRTICLPGHALKVLEDQRKYLMLRQIVSPYVFPNSFGNVSIPGTILISWQGYCRAHNFPPYCLHELRHTAISLYKADVPVELLKAVVGHSASMDTFGTYGHTLSTDGERTAAAMDAVLTNILHPTGT